MGGAGRRRNIRKWLFDSAGACCGPARIDRPSSSPPAGCTRICPHDGASPRMLHKELAAKFSVTSGDPLSHRVICGEAARTFSAWHGPGSARPDNNITARFPGLFSRRRPTHRVRTTRRPSNRLLRSGGARPQALGKCNVLDLNSYRPAADLLRGIRVILVNGGPESRQIPVASRRLDLLPRTGPRSVLHGRDVKSASRNVYDELIEGRAREQPRHFFFDSADIPRILDKRRDDTRLPTGLAHSIASSVGPGSTGPSCTNAAYVDKTVANFAQQRAWTKWKPPRCASTMVARLFALTQACSRRLLGSSPDASVVLQPSESHGHAHGGCIFWGGYGPSRKRAVRRRLMKISGGRNGKNLPKPARQQAPSFPDPVASPSRAKTPPGELAFQRSNAQPADLMPTLSLPSWGPRQSRMVRRHAGRRC